MPNDKMNPFFIATVQATEEAILNALIASETMIGINDNVVYKLPHDLSLIHISETTRRTPI